MDPEFQAPPRGAKPKRVAGGVCPTDPNISMDMLMHATWTSITQAAFQTELKRHPHDTKPGHGLPFGGTKAELRQRLLDHLRYVPHRQQKKNKVTRASDFFAQQMSMSSSSSSSSSSSAQHAASLAATAAAAAEAAIAAMAVDAAAEARARQVNEQGAAWDEQNPAAGAPRRVRRQASLKEYVDKLSTS